MFNNLLILFVYHLKKFSGAKSIQMEISIKSDFGEQDKYGGEWGMWMFGASSLEFGGS